MGDRHDSLDCATLAALLDEYDALTARCAAMQTRAMEAEEKLLAPIPVVEHLTKLDRLHALIVAARNERKRYVRGLEDEAMRLRQENQDMRRLLINARAAYDNACKDRDDEKARANRLEAASIA